MIPINYFSVITAAIISMAIGFLWYGPLFGRAWIRLSDLSAIRLEELKRRDMKRIFAISFLMSLLMAYVLAHFVVVWNARGIAGAFTLAFWVWLGFLATTMMGSVLWEGRPWKLYFLNITYHLVTLSAMSLVLVFWR